MKTLTCLILLTFAGVAGADQSKDGKWLYDGEETIEQTWNRKQKEAADRQIQSVPWSVYSSTPNYTKHTYFDPEYYVTHSTEEFTLSEFVSSGRLCSVIGHKWVSVYDSDMVWAAATGKWAEEAHEWQPYGCNRQTSYCLVCHHCRQKIKVSKQVDEWEP